MIRYSCSIISCYEATIICLPSSTASILFFFFFNDTATTEIYTLSLHDALPISRTLGWLVVLALVAGLVMGFLVAPRDAAQGDRKSTRLNSSHGYISYAVFCLKKKKK